MPDPVTAIIGGVSTVAGGAMQSRAAKKLALLKSERQRWA